MVATAAAVASAAAALGGLGMSVYGTMNAKDNSAYSQLLSIMNLNNTIDNQQYDRSFQQRQYTNNQALYDEAVRRQTDQYNQSRGDQLTQYTNQVNNTIGQQDYNRRLNALMIERSRAGTSDDQGNQTYYDPSTNTWKSVMGAEPARVQRASDLASIERNTTDMRASQRANQRSEMAAITAQPGADAARRDVENFRPMSSSDLEGQLDTRTTQAMNETQRPVMQDMLRQFARTGASAAPVYTQMARDNATNINKDIRDNAIAAMTGVGQVNQGRLAGLTGKLGALQGGTSTPLNFTGISQNDPKNALASLLASRSGSQAQIAPGTPMSASYPINGQRTNQPLPGVINSNGAAESQAGTLASTLAANNGGNPNFGAFQNNALIAQLKDFTSSLGSDKGLGGNLNTIYNYFSPSNGYTGTTPGGQTNRSAGAPGGFSYDETQQIRPGGGGLI